MNRRVVTYLVFIASLALAGIHAAPSGEGKEFVAGEQMLNMEPVGHVYPQGSYREIIDSASNVIHDDAGSLAPFFEKLLRLRSGSGEVVSILHLGDSHIQAGFWDARLKELLQGSFGNAGPGLIVPHKLAGGNEPRWYSVQTKDKYVSGRATSRDLAEKVGFTGVALGISAVEPEIRLWSKEPFSSITVLHHPKAPAFGQPDRLAVGSYCTLGNSERASCIDLTQCVDSITLRATISDGFNNPTIYGFSLANGEPGILLHSAGVNGAAFEHFERNTDFTEGGARDLAPDLIILSLGTNNCYGSNYKSDTFREIAQRFVYALRENYPDAALLITTPMEGCRRSRRSYTVNQNVADVAAVLEAVARDNGVACWNLYEAAGGRNSSAVWYGRRLMQADRLHLTEEGYALQGDMLYDAIVRGYNTYLQSLVGVADRSGAGQIGQTADPAGPGEETIDMAKE